MSDEVADGGKTVVCPCEDVTIDEIDDAIARGYHSMEGVKRSTGVTTGPCQGKYCLMACVRHVATKTGRSPDDVGSITNRPPGQPVPLGALAGPTGARPEPREAKK